MQNRIVTLSNFLFAFIVAVWLMVRNTVVLTWKFIKWLVHQILVFFLFLVDFLGPVAGSIYGRVNQVELFRVLSLASTTTVGIKSFLEFVYLNVDKFITDEYTLSFFHTFVHGLQHNYMVAVIAVAIFVGDLLRRKYHGEYI